jgi:hypothetical protein
LVDVRIKREVGQVFNLSFFQIIHLFREADRLKIETLSYLPLYSYIHQIQFGETPGVGC